MIMPILRHHSRKPVTSVSCVVQSSEPHFKPRGLWVCAGTDEAEDGWRHWCRSENFPIGEIEHRVVLSKDVDILVLRDAAMIQAFTTRYGVNYLGMSPRLRDHYPVVDWHRVARDHQGIIIAPYIWSMRLDDRASWYYTWDVASGCIWDAAAIAAIEQVETENA